MASKRKANVAFGKSVLDGPVSAFAAARSAKLAQQPKFVSSLEERSPVSDQASLTTSAIGIIPYDDGLDDDDDDTFKPDVQDVPKAPLSLHFSTFDAKAVLQDDSTQFRVNLRSEQTVVAVGEYDIEVLEGSVLLYGATLRPRGTVLGSGKPIPGSGKHRVYAPSISAFPQIVAKRDGATICISTVESVFEKLGRLSPLFRNIGSGHSICSFSILRTARDDPLQRSLGLLENDRASSSLLAALANRSQARDRQCTLIVGAKSVGKSTYNRMLCNNIITLSPDRRCHYLDLDPGQPEFGPPGQISLVLVTGLLLGPSFSHPATAESRRFRILRSHTIASTSFKNNPDHYLACVKDLIQCVSQHKLDNVPLVVNSCGWINGIGATVMADVVSLLESHSIDLVTLGSVDSSLVETLQSASSKVETHQLPRRIPRFIMRTPAELRSMQSIAYFHHSGTRKDSSQSAWLSEPIDTLWPYSVTYGGASSDILVISSYGHSLDPVHLAEVLDGAVVALVKVNVKAYDRGPLPQDGHGQTSHSWPSGNNVLTTSEGLPYLAADSATPLNPEQSECIGLALVRGVDVQSKCLLLVTPTSQAQLITGREERIVLIRGAFDSPDWAYLESLYFYDELSSRGSEVDVKDMPWVSRKEMVGVESAVWRLRHPPMASAFTKQ